MQLKQITRDSLLHPLQAVSGIVERRHTLPVLSNVLIEQHADKLSITATDLEIQITAYGEVKAAGESSITVAARKLQDLLRALPEEAQLNVALTANKLAIKAGSSRFSLQTLPASEFPRIVASQEKQSSVSIKERELRNLLRLVEFAMAQQDIRFYLNGMLLVIENDRLIAVATDGHRLSYASQKLTESYQRQEIIIPRKTVLELRKLLREVDEPVTIDILTNQVRFRFANIELVSKVIDGKFPDYKRVIPTNYNNSFTISRMTLQLALQRAAVLANEKYRGVNLAVTENQLKIICSNTEQEEAEEQLTIAYQGNSLDAGFNITYLLDVLLNLSSDEIQLAFGDSNSSALLTMPGRDDYKYIVMPMRT